MKRKTLIFQWFYKNGEINQWLIRLTLTMAGVILLAGWRNFLESRSNGVPFEDPEKTNQTSKDRKLGDEWADWDGSGNSDDTRTPAWIFLVLAGWVLLGIGILTSAGVWLIAPRLAQWNGSFLQTWLMIAAFAYIGLFYLVLWAAYAGMSFFKPWLKHMGGIGWLVTPTVFLGKILGFTRDRMGHAFILVHNRTERLPSRAIEPGRLLLLAPRCLSRESVQGLRALKEKYAFEQVVAFGGTEARKAIGQLRPRGIVAVACERDLLVGIRDVRGRIPVLAFSNGRPEGPCKNTTVDLTAIESAVRIFLGFTMDEAIHINKEGGKSNESIN